MALDGVKVAGFNTAAAGPLTERYLGDSGATVIHVESHRNVDILRTSGPYKDGISGIDRTGFFPLYNANKYGLALDMKNPKSYQLAERLIKWADIVIENWIPGTLDKWALSDKAIMNIKPDIIICHISGQGQFGPHATRRAFGFHLEALGGFLNLSGWPDGAPQGLQAYTDYVSAVTAASIIMAALLHRRKTGQGQVIDLSEYEVGVNFLGPCFLDYFANGTEWQRMGNRHSSAAPHGTFCCRGDDRWCNITIFTDAEWEGFCQELGSLPWMEDSRFCTVLKRKENEDELEKLVEAWTINHTPEQIMSQLQACGIAAGVVEHFGDLFSDPQVATRGFLRKATHAVIGPLTHIITSTKMSRTPPSLRLPAPCFGEHSLYVCKEILGMSDREIDELVMADVFA